MRVYAFVTMVFLVNLADLTTNGQAMLTGLDGQFGYAKSEEYDRRTVHHGQRQWVTVDRRTFSLIQIRGVRCIYQQDKAVGRLDKAAGRRIVSGQYDL